jgi:hypothetical protein
LASARAEASASARDAITAAKARENAEAKARDASASSAASLSELAALKSEHARVVAELAASRAAARGGDEAASRLSAVEATREAIACELEAAASKEKQLHAKVRNLEVELERARAATAAARLEQEEAAAEREDVGRKLETALAEVSRGNRARRRASAGSAPSTPVDARRAFRDGDAGRRTKRTVPATTGKGRTPRRGMRGYDDALDARDSEWSDSTRSGSDTPDPSDIDRFDHLDLDADGAATPAAVAGLVGLARERGSPAVSWRGASLRARASPSAEGGSSKFPKSSRVAFQETARRRRFVAAASFSGAVVLFAFVVAVARGASRSGACGSGGLFGVVAALADEWLSGTVRARFRGRCDGGFATPS